MGTWSPRQEIQLNDDEPFATPTRIRLEDDGGIEWTGEETEEVNTRGETETVVVVRAQLGVSPNVVISRKNSVLVAKEDNFAATLAVQSDGAVLTGTALAALGSIDGIAPVVGDDILLFGQTDPAQNGIWRILELGEAAVSAPRFKRRSDAALSAQVTSQMEVPVAAGTEYAGATFRLTTPDLIALDSTGLTFTSDVIAVGGELGWRRGYTISAEVTTTDAEPTATPISFIPPNGGPVGYVCVAIVRAYESATGKIVIFQQRQSFRKIGSGVPEKLNTSTGTVPPDFVDGTGVDAADGADLVEDSEWDVDENSIVFNVESVSAGSGPTVRWCVTAQIFRL